MTKAEFIQTIRNEIERLYDGEAPKHDQQCDFDDGYFTGIGAISKFLDTLGSEKPMQEGLEEEIDRFEDWMETYDQADYPTSFTTRDIARHFTKWGAEHSGSSEIPNDHLEHVPEIKETGTQGLDEADEKPAPAELEEAADKFAVFYDQGTCDGIAQDCFIAGAKWQKDQDDKDLSEKIAAAYQLGLADKEKQMMKEARNHFVYNILSGNHMKKMIEIYNDEADCRPGDVVRVIIFKKEGEK
jgi:hypothetical protein